MPRVSGGAAQMIGVHRCARNTLTVLARVVRGNHVLALVAFVILYFLDNLVEEVIKKFVGVLMHAMAPRMSSLPSRSLLMNARRATTPLSAGFLEIYT